MQHVGVREHHVGALADLRPRLARRVAVVDRRPQARAEAERGQRAGLVLRERLRRIQVQRTGARIAAQHLERRQVEAQRLARRGPGRDDRRPLPGGVQRARWCAYSRSMPRWRARAATSACSSSGTRPGARGPGPRAPRARAARRPGRRPAGRSTARFAVGGQGLEIVGGDVRERRQTLGESRTFHHSRFHGPSGSPPSATARSRLPARARVRRHVGGIVESAAGAARAGRVDELVVVDAASGDGTAEIARRARAQRPPPESRLLPASARCSARATRCGGRCRSSTPTSSCFLDADTERFGAHFAAGLLGALCASRRLVRQGLLPAPVRAGEPMPEGGGRVNRPARAPALELFYPELAGVRQPLAGEIAAPASCSNAFRSPTGYGVEAAMLIDVWPPSGWPGWRRSTRRAPATATSRCRR